MKEKIYIVTSGYYSDYGIEAVFSTEEKAMEFVNANGTDYHVECFEIDKPFAREENIWRVVLYYPDSEVLSANTITYLSPDLVYRIQDENIAFTLRSDSMDRAVKVASERLAYVKSNAYLYPLLNVKCVETGLFSRQYPGYNFFDCKLLVQNDCKVSDYFLGLEKKALGADVPEDEREKALLELKLKTE